MQITKTEVTPVDLKLRAAVKIADHPPITHVPAVFIRLETRDGRNAWGCAVAHSLITGEEPENMLKTCQICADIVPDLHPTNIEYSLAELKPYLEHSPAASCAYDLAFHDLLGIIADIPLYRLLGGYRNRIQTSVTVPIAAVQESVEIAIQYAAQGFRMLKIKGGLNPEEDVQRIHAIHRSLPHHILRLDADGGYTVEQAIEVANALKEDLEMFEQPTQPSDLNSLRQITKLSSIPVLADQSVKSPASALELASKHTVHGFCIKPATCGGLICARLVNEVARAAQITTMVSCVIEPALLIAAGLSLALSSPNVRYADLDGNLNLTNDPTNASFLLEDGWLIASDVPGLGCTVTLN